jgi:hypothetical protein
MIMKNIMNLKKKIENKSNIYSISVMITIIL